MPAVIRQGDANSAGGIALQGDSSVLVDGRPIVTVQSSVSPHPCCGGKGCSAHCNAKIVKGSSTVFVRGKPVVYAGTTDSCGHSRNAGSSSVSVGK